MNASVYDHAIRAAVQPAGKVELLWSDPQDLPEGLPSVAPFDFRLLPVTLRPFVEDIAERMQCPPDYSAMAAMVGLGAVTGRQVTIRPKREDDWQIVPSLWGMIVGPPSLMKTPAIAEVIKLLTALELAAKSTHEAELADWEARQVVAKEAAKVNAESVRKALKSKEGAYAIARQSIEETEANPPVRKRLLINDTTVEKLGEILADNPRGVLIYRDELRGFLRSMDRDGREADRAFYLEAWNGNSRFTYDRIGRGTIDIEACCVSIIGTIQPGPLSSYLGGAARGGVDDDGLMQRFQLLVYPDCPKSWRNVDRSPDRSAKRSVDDLFNRLDALDPIAIGAIRDDGPLPFLRFDPAAQTLFDGWRAELEQRLRSGTLHPVMEAHLAKYRSLAPSLALLCHLADVGHSPVGAEAMERAAALCDYLESHARRAYDVVLRADLSAARALGEKLLKGHLPNPFSLREVYRHAWSGLSTRVSALAAVEVLEDLDWLRAEQRTTGGRGSTLYHINPKIGARS